jgi:hypothetical protein
MSRLWESARGAADLKLVIALFFAVGGLSWAAYSLLSGREGPLSDEPRILASALDSEGNAVETSYSKASSDRQIDAVESQLSDLVFTQTQSALGEISVPKGTPQGVSDSVVNAFIPILQGDYDGFLEAIAALGGKLAEDLDEEHPIFTQLAKVFKNAKVDLSRITVAKYEAPVGGAMGMRRRAVEETDDIDEADLEGAPQTRMQRSVMEMRPASLFPDAPSKADPTALEVQIPVQPKGEEHESVFSLILTWNPQAKLWQPSAYRTIQSRLMEEEG